MKEDSTLKRVGCAFGIVAFAFIAAFALFLLLLGDTQIATFTVRLPDFSNVLLVLLFILIAGIVATAGSLPFSHAAWPIVERYANSRWRPARGVDTIQVNLTRGEKLWLIGDKKYTRREYEMEVKLPMVTQVFPRVFLIGLAIGIVLTIPFGILLSSMVAGAAVAIGGMVLSILVFNFIAFIKLEWTAKTSIFFCAGEHAVECKAEAPTGMQLIFPSGPLVDRRIDNIKEIFHIDVSTNYQRLAEQAGQDPSVPPFYRNYAGIRYNEAQTENVLIREKTQGHQLLRSIPYASKLRETIFAARDVLVLLDLREAERTRTKERVVEEHRYKGVDEEGWTPEKGDQKAQSVRSKIEAGEPDQEKILVIDIWHLYEQDLPEELWRKPEMDIGHAGFAGQELVVRSEESDDPDNTVRVMMEDEIDPDVIDFRDVGNDLRFRR